MTKRSCSVKVGDKHNKLFVKAIFWTTRGKKLRRDYLCICQCECGNITKVWAAQFRNGRTKSCGCLNKEQATAMCLKRKTHGKSRTRIYKRWTNMMQRCYNPKNKRYKDYGGRGIRVCERWHNFENFYEDMGECPRGLTIERKNNDGNYCPANCKWGTREEQNNNTRRNKWIEHNGKKMTEAQWAKYSNIKITTFQGRLRRGWSIEKALTTPVNHNLSRKRND